MKENMSLDDLKLEVSEKNLDRYMKMMSHLIPRNEKEKALKKKKARTKAKMQKASKKQNRR